LSPKFELFAISENEFTRRDENHQFAFARGEGGKVASVKIRFNGATVEARRLAQGEVIPYEQLIAGKFAEAIEAYKKIKREKPGDDAVAEERLNGVGYSLLGQKNIAAAIAVFKANVELYPQSSNVYDSLGEAYMANGEKELAVINYKKSLELNPQNKNAAEMLKKLEQP
jgi:tetratricopeptide (TPR) repeat protein